MAHLFSLFSLNIDVTGARNACIQRLHAYVFMNSNNVS